MAFTLDITISLGIIPVVGRDIQDAIVQHIEDVNTRQVSAGMTGLGQLDIFEQGQSIFNGLAFEFLVCHFRFTIEIKLIAAQALVRIDLSNRFAPSR